MQVGDAMSNYKSTDLKLKQLIKDCMPVSDYKITFGVMKDKAVKSCKLSLDESNQRIFKTGDNEILGKSYVLSVYVHSGTSEEDVDNGFKYCEAIYNTLNKVINKVTEDKTLGITHIDSIGSIKELNVNRHGIWRYELSFEVYYVELD